jgi:hypothetical protein
MKQTTQYKALHNEVTYLMVTISQKIGEDTSEGAIART